MPTDQVEASVHEARFRKLTEINTLISTGDQSIQQLLSYIVGVASETLGGDSASLLLVDEKDDALFFQVVLGNKSSSIKNLTISADEGIAGWVFQRKKALIVNDVEKDERFSPKIDKKSGYHTRAIAAAPLVGYGKCLGVMEVILSKTDGHFSEVDLEWLQYFSTQAALAILNAGEYASLRSIRAVEALGKNQEKMIYSPRSVMNGIIAQIDRIAPVFSPVLITGESGTGKELIAEMIHARGERSGGPFVAVNCAALPEDLIESELFGHERGAFTGADKVRRGRFEVASGGTIFLDEIGEIPLHLQTKLLRALQSRSIERVGSVEPIPCDVRVIAATNRDLEKAIHEGEFREDLYFRINVLPIYLPPLRERGEDIVFLAKYFLEFFAKKHNRTLRDLSQGAVEAVYGYSWPGNIREMMNVMERMVLMGEEESITAEELNFPESKSRMPGLDGEGGKDLTLKEGLQLFKKGFVEAALARNRGNQTETARKLGIQRTYLSRLIKELNIVKGS
ncbi:MAG: sigma-54-dependent Fis family transcriptional regulator [Spirochaetales bacterium]|nr:sigma-54-dependent Fis family transcriptional regulator [Spirochaetales bacterium]